MTVGSGPRHVARAALGGRRGVQGASAAEIKTEMIRGGVQSLRMAGIAKILDGVTTPEEILRSTVED